MFRGRSSMEVSASSVLAPSPPLLSPSDIAPAVRIFLSPQAIFHPHTSFTILFSLYSENHILSAG